MNNNIFFLGSVSDPGVVLEKSCCFVLSSTREGNPISVLEAMSYGLPIIAPNVGGIPDIVTDNENGYLFETNNVQDLIGKMTSILENKTNLELFSNKNLERIKAFSIDKTKDEYKKFFNEFIEK